MYYSHQTALTLYDLSDLNPAKLDMSKRPANRVLIWPRKLHERVESMAVVIATGVNLEGRREVLGLDVIPAESEEGWTQSEWGRPTTESQ